MKTTVIYRDNTDYSRQVNDFLRDFSRQTGKTLAVLDPDTNEGLRFCQAHDIVEYPTVVATDDAGHHLQMWRGLPLPRINEVSYFVD